MASLFDDVNEPEEDDNRGRWWGPQFCPVPGQLMIDGCYFCGRPIRVPNYHNHTDIGDGRYSCVCESC